MCLTGCVATHVEERSVPEKIPFVTNFCSGVGHSFWLDGEVGDISFLVLLFYSMERK
jgi:endo-beta-N-acetylglucosaminidase D